MSETLVVPESAEHELYSRICVRKPYFALGDLRVSEPGSVSARIPVEMRSARERSPITLAEGGRHLAILGLCAAASTVPDTKRRYYLASTARITWLHTEPLGDVGALHGKAVGRCDSPRKASASTELRTESGIPVARYEFGYDIISTAAFGRLFATMNMPGAAAPTDISPYRSGLALRDVHPKGETLTATIQAKPEECAGHFLDYPALPVSMLGAGMVDAAVQCADTLRGHPDFHWITRTADLNAYQLVPAGTSVRLTATPLGSAAGQLTIAVKSTVQDVLVADLLLHMTLLN